VFLYGLPVAQYPEIVPPTIQVSTRYPGASAEVVAATIGVPLEQAINGVENSIYMSSTSASDGSYTLTITFEVGNGPRHLAGPGPEPRQHRPRPSCREASPPRAITILKVSPNILLVASLYSEDDRYDETFFSNYAIINVQNPLARIQGVGQIRIFGAGPYSMRVWLDPKRLQTFGLTTQDVLDAIRGQNIEVVAGQIGGPPVPENQPFQFTINALGRLSDASEFDGITIKSAIGTAPQLVRLRDVGRVELSQQSYSNFSRFTGHKAAQIVVFALPGANAIQVADRVYKAMAEMSQQFPAGMKYAIRYDTTLFVREAIHAVYVTLFIAGVLVLVVILLFLQNFRGMLVPATTVPVTIIGAFIAMAGLGFTVNLMTLFALILAIGIVVDDAIIIVENSSYYIEQGMPPKEATIRAMEELTGR
jgi:HAE1 family hydrophobic/amphiphilic exporter-1